MEEVEYANLCVRAANNVDATKILLEDHPQIMVCVMYTHSSQEHFESVIKDYIDKLPEWFENIELTKNTIILQKYMKFNKRQIADILSKDHTTYEQFKCKMQFRKFSKLYQFEQTIIFNESDEFRKLANHSRIARVIKRDIQQFTSVNLEMTKIFMEMPFLKRRIQELIQNTFDTGMAYEWQYDVTPENLEFYLDHFDIIFNQSHVCEFFEYPKIFHKIKHKYSARNIAHGFLNYIQYDITSGFYKQNGEIKCKNINLEKVVEIFELVKSRDARRELNKLSRLDRLSGSDTYKNARILLSKFFDGFMKPKSKSIGEEFCAICQDTKQCYKFSKCKKHGFCEICIIVYVKNKNDCPVCLTRIEFVYDFSTINMKNIEKYRSSDFQIEIEN